MAYIKNIEHERALTLANQVSVQPGQIVSRTLAQNPYVSVTLFAFAQGEEIGTHDSEGDRRPIPFQMAYGHFLPQKPKCPTIQL